MPCKSLNSSTSQESINNNLISLRVFKISWYLEINISSVKVMLSGDLLAVHVQMSHQLTMQHNRHVYGKVVFH